MVVALALWCTPRATAQPAIPHSFQSIAMNSDGTALLSLAGRTTNLFRQFYDLYPIEVSSDLIHWQPLTTLVRTNSSTNSLEFLDPIPAGQLARFYRTPTNHFPTPYPRPTGPYPVGTFTRFFTDPARTNRHGIKGNSSFLVSFWYPAELTAGKWPAPFFDAKVASAWYGADSDYAVRFPNMVAQQLAEAPCAREGAPFPVILYSHGAYGWRTENVHDFAELASHGFVVASADHLDSGATLTPDGRAVGTSDVTTDRTRYFTNKVADLVFLVHSLTNLNADDPILKERLDLSRKGAFGWSFGAGATLRLAMDDPSVLAFASLDGALGDVSIRSTNTLHKPLMIMGLGSSLLAYSTNQAYAMQVRNAVHRTYADPLPFFESPSLSSRRVAGAIAGCVLSFFRKHLKNEDDGLLDDPASRYPDIYDFKKK